MKILIADKEASERMFLEELLQKQSLPVEVSEQFAMDEETLLGCIAGTKILIVGLAKVTAAVIERADRLELICKAGIGTDNIDVAAATSNNIVVTRTPDINTQGVAEYVIGAMIALLRHTTLADRLVRSASWGELRRRWSGKMGEIRGRTLGLVGFGAIARNVAQLAQPLGLRILAYDPYVQVNEMQVGVEFVDLSHLLSISDFVSIHAVLTEETYHLINKEALAMMKPTAFVINTARGPIVDESALATALEAGQIAGAALDVFDPEPPLSKNPLFNFDNVILSPHIAGCTEEGYRAIGALVAQQVRDYLSGKPFNLHYVVNPTVLDGR